MGNELATVLIAAVYIALLVWVTLTAQRYEKYSGWKIIPKIISVWIFGIHPYAVLGLKQLTSKEATVKAIPVHMENPQRVDPVCQTPLTLAAI